MHTRNGAQLLTNNNHSLSHSITFSLSFEKFTLTFSESLSHLFLYYFQNLYDGVTKFLSGSPLIQLFFFSGHNSLIVIMHA